MKKHGFYIISRCKQCETNEENMDHIFVHCPSSKYLWLFLGDCFKRNLDLSEGFEAVFHDAMKDKFSLQIHTL